MTELGVLLELCLVDSFSLIFSQIAPLCFLSVSFTYYSRFLLTKFWSVASHRWNCIALFNIKFKWIVSNTYQICFIKTFLSFTSLQNVLSFNSIVNWQISSFLPVKPIEFSLYLININENNWFVTYKSFFNFSLFVDSILILFSQTIRSLFHLFNSKLHIFIV